MRDVPNQVDQKKATEPIILLRVDWGSGTAYYADKDVSIGSEAFEGRILDFSPLSNQITANLAGEVINASIVLDDTDGVLKDIVDADVIEGTSVTVYQYFEDMDEEDIIVLLRGKIYGAVTWSEGERTLAFEVQTYVFDAEIGYKPSEEDIDYYSWDSRIEGKPWPMIFGIPEKVQAVKLWGTTYVANTSVITPDLDGAREVVFSLDDYGALPSGNFYLTVYPTDPKTWGAHAIAPIKFYGYVDPNSGVFFPQDWTNPLTSNVVWGDNIPIYQELEIADRPTYADSVQKDNPRMLWLENQYVDLRGQICLVELKVGDIYGYQVNRCIVQQGQFCIFEKDFYGTLGGNGDYDDCQILEVAPVPRKEWGDNWGNDLDGNTLSEYRLKNYVDLFSGIWSIVDITFNYNTYYYETGCKVQVMVNDTMTYICDTIGGGSVVEVYYEKNIEGNKYLGVLDSSLYTFHSEGNIGPLTGVSYLEIDDSLTIEQIDQYATGDIYITINHTNHTRVEGARVYNYNFRNSADVIKYLIDVYSDTGYDYDSFFDTEQYVEDYPCDFKLDGGQQLLTVLKDIAWQSRCALSIRNGTFFLKYLSVEPDDTYSLYQEVIEFKSIELGFKDSTNIVTCIEAPFYEDWYGDPSMFIYRNNEDQYGLIKETIPVYIYKYRSYAQFTIGFWGYRMSESWRRITLKSFLNALRLEAFDALSLRLDALSANTIRGMVDYLNYDSLQKRIDLTAELASKSGDVDSDNQPEEDPNYWLGDPRYQIPDQSITPANVPQVTYLTLAFLKPNKFETAYYKGSTVLQYTGTNNWNNDHDDFMVTIQSLIDHYTNNYVSYGTAIVPGGLYAPDASYGAHLWEYSFWDTKVTGVPCDDVPGCAHPNYAYTRYISVDADATLDDLKDAFYKAGGDLVLTQKVKIFKGAMLTLDGFFQSGTAYDEFVDWLDTYMTVEEESLVTQDDWLSEMNDYYENDIPTP